MKQYYYLIMIIVGALSFNGIQAQTNTTMHLLTQHAWANEDKTHIVKFDKENFYSFSNLEKFNLGKTSVIHKYYLSNTPDYIEAEVLGNKYNKVAFKEPLVGKVQNGIYFMTPHRAFWIEKISETSLIFIADAPSAIRQVLVPYYGEFPKE